MSRVRQTMIVIVMAWRWLCIEALQFQYASFVEGDEIDVVQQAWYSDESRPNAYKDDGALWLTAFHNNSQNGASEADGTNVGRAVFRNAVRFQLSNLSFSTSFSFQIVTTRSYPNCGSGMAFFISDSREAPQNSDSYGALGLMNPNQLTSSVTFFAVEFDTAESTRYDDVSASHIGIDVNSMASLNVTDTAPDAGSPYYPDLFLYDNSSFTAWIQYDHSSNLIQVCMVKTNSSHSAANSSTGGENAISIDRPLVPCLQLNYDLSSVLVGRDMYLGFSATTAPASRGMEGHVIYAWSFNNESANNPSPTFHYVLVASAVGVTLGILVILCVYMVKRRRNKSKHAHAVRIEDALRSARPFSYRELEKATEGFSEAMKVGEGGYGAVYKGVLRDGSVVAVKKLRMSTMLEDQFYAEARIIKKARHRYLLELQGWCYEEGQAALLVSQYMSRGSLDRYLFDGIRKRELGSSVTMQKETRIRILTQVAAALEYLHGGLGDCVLHRDVKAANVLLTEGEKMEARLGDFGLAKLISRDVGIVSMSAAGTPGYVAPEVLFNGMATEKADVYSFGVLTLEVLSGRRTISTISAPSNSEHQLAHVHLPYWLWSTLDLGGGIISDEQLCKVLDPMLLPSPAHAESASDYDYHLGGGDARVFWDDWRCIVHLGLMCCHPLPQCRPTMKEVSRAFDHRILLPLPPDTPCSLYPFHVHPASTVFGNTSHNSVHNHSRCYDHLVLFILNYYHLPNSIAALSSSMIHLR